MEYNPYQPSSASVSGAAGTPQGSMVSQSIIGQLVRTRPWVRLLSVMSFLGAGLMLVIGVIMLVAGGAGMASGMGSSSSSGAAAFGGGMMMGMSMFYILIALLYIYPGLKLWKYANRITGFASTGAEVDLEKALNEQRSFWKFAGISVIVIVSLYIVGIAVFAVTAGIRAAKMGGSF
jgi:hypothetical protein